MNSQDNPGQDGSQTHRVKLVLVGYQGVGKSSIERRSVSGTFEERMPTTLRCYFATKVVSVENQMIKFEIWDTAGQERYHSLAPMYYRAAHVAMVVYDVTSADTYNRALDWIQEVRRHCDSEVIVVLVGNKVDLAEVSRTVLTEDAHSYASENGMIFAETSAKTGVGIEDVFLKVAQRLAKRLEQGWMPDGKRGEVSVKVDEGKAAWGYCC